MKVCFEPYNRCHFHRQLVHWHQTISIKNHQQTNLLSKIDYTKQLKHWFERLN
ncbi:hypothetical protein GOQ30_02120 [Flavobacterium sp. TP390]|uniref:Uncharacterized protein n=1 Tax=Flavobacterium profundi TaxID=1774945 RepID=A0A6I4IET2_9FLAO|nr:hypothetical protein [Flavobacterium profundi]